MVDVFCHALEHQAYFPCRMPGTRKCPLSAQSPCLEHRGSSILSVYGCPWEESQSLETLGLRKAHHPMPAASRRAKLWWEVSSVKKGRGSSGAGDADTPLLCWALTCLCQEPAARLAVGHCSPPWSRCLQCIFVAYQLLLPAPSSAISDAEGQLPARQTRHRMFCGAGQMCAPREIPAAFVTAPSRAARLL